MNSPLIEAQVKATERANINLHSKTYNYYMINATSTKRCYTLSQTEAKLIVLQKKFILQPYFRHVVTVVDANCCSKGSAGKYWTCEWGTC